MRLLGRDADWDNAEHAPLITGLTRRDPLNLTTLSTLLATFHPARPGP